MLRYAICALLIIPQTLLSFQFANAQSSLDFKNHQTHIGINGMKYLKTDRKIIHISEVYGFKVPAHKGSSIDIGDYSGNRGATESKDYFENFAMVDCFQGKVVLDLASGGGSFVRELFENGIDAHGIDVINPREETQCESRSLLLKEISSPLTEMAIMQGNITNLPYRENSVDRIISTWGPFSYFDGKTKKEEKKLLLETFEKTIIQIKKVLKPGGMALIGPIAELYYGEKLPLTAIEFVQNKLAEEDDFKVYKGLGRPASHCRYCHYMIITKGEVNPQNFCAKSE